MNNKIRQNTLKTIFNKYELEPAHAIQVKKLALIIFDKTKSMIHNLSSNDRALLEAGALLHDIGYFISAKDHHKNSQKLILQEKMEGFSDAEKLIVANITRYHRGKLPSKKHNLYESLSQKDKKLVNKLSSFVRLADSLDSSHCSVVDDVDFRLDEANSTLSATLKLSTPSYYFEICKAQDKKDFFEKEFGVELQFIV